MLRNQREGWTPALRREYFTFANYALGFRGGNVYIQMLREMVVEALRNSTPAERQAVADITGRTFLAQPDFTVTPPNGPGRQWEVGEKHPSGPSLKLLNLLDRKGLQAVL